MTRLRGRAFLVLLAFSLGCEVQSTVGSNGSAQSGTTNSCPDESVLKRCTRNDCVVTDLSSNDPGFQSIAVDPTHLYVALGPAGPGLEEALGRIPKLGGAPELLTVAVQPIRITLNSTHLLWSTHSGTVGSVAKTGGEASKLGPFSGNLVEIVANEAFVYVTIPMDNEIGELSLASGGMRQLGGQSNPSGLALDGQYVYWINNGLGTSDGEIVRAPLGRLSETEVLASGLNEPTEIALGSDRIVFANQAGQLFSVARSGGAPASVVSQSLGDVRGLVVVDDTVFVSSDRGLLKVRDAQVSELDRRSALALTSDCSGLYAQGWYDPVILRYGD